jgi:diguanylate cyclase
LNTVAESSALRAEIVDMLYANNRRSLMAAIVVMVALLLVQQPLINPAILGVWTAIFLMAYGARAFLTRQYEKDQQHALHNKR